MKRTRQTLAITALALAMLPMALILLAAALAAVTGCEINEAAPQPCTVLGGDFGATLTGLVSVGWLGLLSIPFVMLLVCVWLLAESGSAMRRRRRARREQAGGANTP